MYLSAVASIVVAAVVFTNTAVAECPNACSAHGKCGAYDMCTCYRNWMSNDCSERVCQFGLAHVDTPKGDLDSSSGALAGPGTTVVTNNAMYPKGTTEQFPNMVDSDQTVLTNTAHYYMECSNKGVCDRQSGNCQCFEGYTGSACQRAACPDTGSGVCSGHGTCQNIKTISNWDYGNVYKLWDEQATMGCVCDGGYSGSNCEEKMCKFGADPLYQDSFQTIRYSNWTYSIYTRTAATVTGNYSIIFYDSLGEDWHTDPIDIGATCADVVSALEGMPNNVIPSGSVLCQKWATDALDSGSSTYEPIDTSATTMHAKFTLAFPSNVGVLKQMGINIYLDGTRPTLFTDETSDPSLGWYIFSNGFYGENKDFVPDLCEGVTVTLNKDTSSNTDEFDYLDGLTSAELILLKKCLGDANGDSTDNEESEVFNWDHGSAANPHLIKLIDATQDDNQYSDSDPTHFIPKQYAQSYLCSPYDGNLCKRMNPPGFYAAIYWDGTSQFRILGRPSADYGTSTQFHVYTTTGYLNRVSDSTIAFNSWDGMVNATQNLHANKLYTTARSGQTRENLDCETSTSGLECLQKEDYFMVLNTGRNYATAESDTAPTLTTAQRSSNAIYPQIYQVKKISNEPIPSGYLWDSTNGRDFTSSPFPTFVRNQIVADKGFNVDFHLDSDTAASDTSAIVFKFYPPSNAYEYAAQCSNRGVCDHTTGLCQCFNGYTNDNCNTIDALAA